MLTIKASYKHEDLFFQGQTVGFLWNPCKGLFQCPNSRLQDKLSHSQYNFFYGVSKSYCSLAWLWKLHHNLAPRKFTYFEKQITGVTCCFVTNSLKHELNVSVVHSHTETGTLCWVCILDRKRAPCHLSAIVLICRTFCFSQFNKILARLTSSRCLTSMLSQCVLKCMISDVQCRLKLKKKKVLPPTVHFPLFHYKKILMAKRSELDKFHHYYYCETNTVFKQLYLPFYSKQVFYLPPK